MERMLKDQKEKKELMAKYNKIKMNLVYATFGFYVLFAICCFSFDHGLAIFTKNST